MDVFVFKVIIEKVDICLVKCFLSLIVAHKVVDALRKLSNNVVVVLTFIVIMLMSFLVLSIHYYGRNMDILQYSRNNKKKAFHLEKLEYRIFSLLEFFLCSIGSKKKSHFLCRDI